MDAPKMKEAKTDAGYKSGIRVTCTQEHQKTSLPCSPLNRICSKRRKPLPHGKKIASALLYRGKPYVSKSIYPKRNIYRPHTIF